MTPQQAANTIREALELSRDLPCGVPEARLADLQQLDSMYGPALAALKVLEDAATWPQSAEDEYRDNLHDELAAAAARADTLTRAVTLADRWLDLNYGYLKPDDDPLLVEFADAVRAALSATPEGDDG